ncbi:MAG: DUF1801 domain-containing protein [Verrucomicrobiota bacterium]
MTIDSYIASCPREVQARLRKIRAVIRRAAPGAEETIKYRIPTFVLNGNLVHFACFKKHIGFYPTSSGIREFRRDLAGYKHAAGSVQFPLDQPVPFDLIRKIVRFRVKENRERTRSRRSRRTKSPPSRKS